VRHFIIELTYTVPFQQLADTLPDHRRFLRAGYEQGLVLFSGPQEPKVGGIIVARMPSLEALQQFFAADPFQQRGLATYRFIEFEPLHRQSFLEDWVTKDPPGQ
jgi:uncharacterized protein YciI